MDVIEWATTANGAGRVSAPRGSGAKICDTSSCQVYGGAAVRSSLATPINYLESRLSNQAIADTATLVRRYGDGNVANTMFSSSNGGRSVSNGLYPVVDDPGDAVAPNPHNSWSLTMSASNSISNWQAQSS